jgi:hypothetical protein
VIVDWVVDHALSVEDVMATVELTVVDDMVVVAQTVGAAIVEVDAWLTQFTVVVFVSPPPTYAGWYSLPSLLVWASVKTMFPEE